MKDAKTKFKEAGWTNVQLEVSIGATREQVWEALVNEIGLWWRKDFYSTPKTKSFILEPKLGGRMYEDAGNGAGVLWYTVMAIDPQNSLTLSGHSSVAWGGPLTNILHLNLKDAGKTTILEISDAFVGNVDGGCDREDGWRLLFAEGLKPHIERRFSK